MKVVSSKQMTKLESKAISNGAVDAEFMEEAGLQVARLVHAFVEREDLEKQVVLLCGKGNNAGDAYVAGIHLLNMNYSVHALQLFSFKECSPLCQMNQTRFFNAGGLVQEILSIEDFALPLQGVIVDGIFGTGFSGRVKEPIASMIEYANQSKLPIISIDIPSGLNGDTGVVSGDAIIANETAFLGLPKVGFFLEEGFNHVGHLRYVDFGLPFKYIEEAKADFSLIEANFVKSCMPFIKRNRNKYEAGFVAALAGSPGMSGAAILSSFAALNTGAGIVKLFHPENMENELAAAPYEIIKVAYGKNDEKKLIEQFNKANAVLIGPGIGREASTIKLLKKILPQIEKPVVIDADALTLLSENKMTLPKNTILTPHKGEMERLLHAKTKQKLDMAFIEACRVFAEINEVTLVLKGAPTFIFQKNEPIYINITGSPGMATAGSGDVLTGMIAALLAQGLDLKKVAILGTFAHGISGEMASYEKSPYCMIASDLIYYLPETFKSISNAF